MKRNVSYYTVVLCSVIIIGCVLYYSGQLGSRSTVPQGTKEILMFQLPPLPYEYSALEPYMDARTVEIHYAKHHQGYVDKLNAAVASHPAVAARAIGDVLKDLNAIPHDIREAVRNFGGGVYNHTFFWNSMKKNGGGIPHGTVAQAINQAFGSFDAFKVQFSDVAKKLFGSGWAWLVVDASGKLLIQETINQDCPLSRGYTPLVCLDVWEHAYYLKYQNRRADFVDAWWNLIDWDAVEQRYANR